MATNLKNKQIQDMTREELQDQVKILRSQNKYLQKQLNKARHVGHLVTEMREDLRIRCDKHFREKIRLQNCEYVVNISAVIIAICGMALVIHALVLAVFYFGEQYGLSKADVPWFIRWITSDKIGTFIVGILGIALSVPSQMIFPAPKRTYLFCTIFAIKQMVNIFMPNWCIGFLGLLAAVALAALNMDRIKQVSFTIIYFL
jgi:hypothetical protein